MLDIWRRRQDQLSEERALDATARTRAERSLGHMLHELELLLGQRYEHWAMKFPSGEDPSSFLRSRDQRLQEILTLLRIETPTSDVQGQRLLAELHEEGSRLRSRARELTLKIERIYEEPSRDLLVSAGFQPGEAVVVQRSSGAWEIGWQVQEIRADGWIQVTKPEENLQKHVLATELRGWNPFPFLETSDAARKDETQMSVQPLDRAKLDYLSALSRGQIARAERDREELMRAALSEAV